MSLTAFRRGSSGVRRAHTCRPSCLRYRRRRRTLDGVESENGPAKQSRVAPTPLSVSSHSPKFVFFFKKKKKAKRNRRHFYWVSPYDTLMTSIGFLKYGLCYCGSRRCVIERKLATVSSTNPSTEHRSHWPSKRVFCCCCCCCFFVTAIGSDEQSKCAAGDNIE